MKNGAEISSLFKGLRVKGRALAVSKGRAFGGIFKGKALKLRFPKAEPLVGFLRAEPLN